MQVSIARGKAIFTALGRKTAANWGITQLTSAVTMGLSQLATAEVIAKIHTTDPEMATDIEAMLSDPSAVVFTTEDTVAIAAKPAKAAKATAKAAAAVPAAKPAKAAKASAKAPAAKPAKAAKASAKAPAPAAKPVKAAKATAKAAAAVPAAKPTKATKAAAAPAAPPAKATKSTKAAAQPVAAAEEAADGTVGVRYTASRPHACGVVFLQYGVQLGVTPELIAAVDELYGKANPRESEFALRNAWQVLRGYMGWENAELLAESNGIAVTDLQVKGVRFGNNRSYMAGVVLARNGITGGVTEAMVAEVDAELPDDMQNPYVSVFALRNGWHALRGYFGIDTPEQAAAQDAS